ncbi:MAG: cytochrome P450 [Ilumatobacter sp.]|uniref:cytochrome P450 n=1 Tax=Ilumatobacter sp. TaxID=1967498 RepID=UPI003C722CEA
MTETLEPIRLHDPATFASGIPHELFASMRSTVGLTRSPDVAGTAGFWSVTRHRDLVQASRDVETFSSAVGHIQIYDIDDDALDERASMIDMDPPMHTRLRRLVSSAFTPRHVQAYRDAVRTRIRRVLDEFEAAGGGDWVSAVAKPIPIGVICDLMGVPAADHAYMVELSDHLVAGTGSEPLEPTAYGNTTDLRLLPFNSPAAFAMSAYASELAAVRRAEPADDLISGLVHAEIDGERLTDAEFANFFRLMIFAGNETTRSSMAHLALHLHRFGDEFERVRVDRSLLASATDEVIRYSSPILYFRRTVTAPTALSGTDLAVGDKVVLWYAAANFDDDVFPDPLEFRVDRPTTPTHLAFGGGGAHFCLGASLAKLEVAELIDEILDRDLDFDDVGEPEFVESNFVNGIERLRIGLHG